jgi:hypothetical protein
MDLLADLEVTTKSDERVSESIGADIAAVGQREIDYACDYILPIILGEPVPTLYIELGSTGVPAVKKETEGLHCRRRRETAPFPAVRDGASGAGPEFPSAGTR